MRHRNRSTSRPIRPPAFLQQRANGGRRAELPPAGRGVVGTDGCRAGALSRSAVVARAGGAARRRRGRVVAVGVRACSRSRGWRSRRTEIDVQTLERRLPTRGVGDELDQVVDAFNGTLCRLEHAVGEMRQFSAALAHELRTPLAALRGEIELASRTPGSSPAQRDRFASQMEEIDRLTRLIDQILTLARAESGQIRLTRAPVNLTELAVSLVEQLEPMAAAKSIDLRCEPLQAVMVEGDFGWLQRLLLNLVDNALKFTREHGHVVVRVTREDGTARDGGAGHRCRPVVGRCATGVRTILPGRSRAVLLHGGRGARPQPGPVDRGTAPRNRHSSEPPR